MSNWYPHNKEVLDQLISRYRDDGKKHYAVFDWDDSVTIGDTQTNLFMYQAEWLRYGWKPEHVLKNLQGDIPDEIFYQKDENGVSPYLVGKDIERDYTYLYKKEYVSPKPDKKHLHDEWSKEPAWHNLKAKLLQWLHVIQTPERIQELIYIIAFAYAEMRVDDYLALVQECHTFYHTHPHFHIPHYETPKDYPNHSGFYAEDYESGFFVTEEMRDLLWQIHNAGIDIYVISSSDYYDVYGAASNPTFSFPPIKEFFTMKQEVRDGILCPKHIPLKCWTRKQGKADTVNQIIRPRYGEAPLLIVGDSEGDYEMMSQCEAKVVLQINRGNGGKLQALKEKALSGEQEGTIYLLQGVDRNQHCFRPDQKTIPTEENEPIL